MIPKLLERRLTDPEPSTVRACREQTAAFRWAHLYESVEGKIDGAMRIDGSEPPTRKRRKTPGKIQTSNLESVTERNLPFPVLHSLIMWLRSLQDFPEHRLLHLRCNSGISTAVIWGHYILGFTVAVDINGVEVRFGDGNANIHIEESDVGHAGASLMDPADSNQLLFELANDDNNPTISSEHREEAFGFGLKVLQYAGVAEEDVQDCIYWLIARSFSIGNLSSDPSLSHHDANNTEIRTEQLKWAQNFHRARYPSQDRLLMASRFLFALDHIDPEILEGLMQKPLKKALESKIKSCIMIALLVSFARIHEGDLDHCRNMPLSLGVYQKIQKKEHCTSFLEIQSKERLFKAYEMTNDVDLINSFEFLARLLLGNVYSDQYVAPAALVSAWGWSIFFNSIDAMDPADVSVTAVRVLQGVPCRGGRRKARIVDGPTEVQMSSTQGEIVMEKPPAAYFPGVSTAQMDRVSVGQISDAFQFSRIFKWKSFGVSEKTHKLGFRAMQEACTKGYSLRPCEHEDYTPDFMTWIDHRVGHLQSSNSGKIGISTELSMKWPRSKNGQYDKDGAERVFGNDHQLTKHLWFYVTDNPAARWLQLDDLYNSCDNLYWYFVRGPQTCLKCATENSGLNNFAPTLVLL